MDNLAADNDTSLRTNFQILSVPLVESVLSGTVSILSVAWMSRGAKVSIFEEIVATVSFP